MNVNVQTTKVYLVFISLSLFLFCQELNVNSQTFDSTDVGIVEVVLPEQFGFCNISEVVHIQIANYGLIPISNLELKYTIVNQSNQATVSATEIYTGIIPPEDTVDYFFNQLTGLSGYGFMFFDFSCFVNYPYDNNPSNNCMSYVISGPELLMGYLNPNEGPVYDSISCFMDDYFIFDVTEDITEVCISLCGSSFDTQLAIYKCTQSWYGGTFPYYYNGDYCGLQSQITIVGLSTGRYYADVFGWSQSGGYGQFVIEYTTKNTQTIDLPQGWSIMSSYIKPDTLDMNYVFNSQINQISLVKSGNGNVFWPQYNVNQIGDFSNLEGYQIQTLNPIEIEISGVPVNPDTCLIEVSPGWGIIPYLNNESDSISSMLQTISNNIIIIKNGDGAVYWPMFNVNMIQVLNPGEGYQINSANSDTLIYPTY